MSTKKSKKTASRAVACARTVLAILTNPEIKAKMKTALDASAQMAAQRSKAAKVHRAYDFISGPVSVTLLEVALLMVAGGSLPPAKP